MENTYLSHDVIKAVLDHYIKEGFKVFSYDDNFAPARVPIFARKDNSNPVFVDVITEAEIKSDYYFKDREYSSAGRPWKIKDACSAVFFRHYFPEAEVYWAIPEYSVTEIESFKKFVEKCKENNIGLLKIKKERDQFNINIHLRAKPLLEERKQILSTISDSKEELNKYISQWSDEDVSYLVFYPELIYQNTEILTRDRNNISKDLILRMGELKNVAYKDILSKFSEEYSESKDDCEIARKITQKLWRLYDIDYPNLHKDFEGILKRNPKYRDHFLHAFQVFLHGTFIIDKLYSKIPKDNYADSLGSRIEDAWLLAATYHDYNYMIQNFDEWSDDFFKEALHLDNYRGRIATLDLSEPYVKNGYMFKTQILTKCLGMTVNDVVLGFLYDRILTRKNHGLISGLSLLKYLDNKNHKFNERAINHACKAISIHDDDIWKFLSGHTNEYDNNPKYKDDKYGDEFKKQNKILNKLDFNENPISFLLILTDNLQEVGRGKQNAIEPRVIINFVTEFKDGTISSEIFYDGTGARTAYDYKIKAFDILSNFLKADELFHVNIHLKGDHKNVGYKI
ncbi:MAG: hypothetical protein AABY87_09030 [bacterium]